MWSQRAGAVDLPQIWDSGRRGPRPEHAWPERRLARARLARARRESGTPGVERTSRPEHRSPPEPAPCTRRLKDAWLAHTRPGLVRQSPLDSASLKRRSARGGLVWAARPGVRSLERASDGARPTSRARLASSPPRNEARLVWARRGAIPLRYSVAPRWARWCEPVAVTLRGCAPAGGSIGGRLRPPAVGDVRRKAGRAARYSNTGETSRRIRVPAPGSSVPQPSRRRDDAFPPSTKCASMPWPAAPRAREARSRATSSRWDQQPCFT